MIVDQEFARWLKEGGSFSAATDAAIAALWGELARETEIMSPLALAAGADAEGARQIAFLGGILAIDEHIVSGLRAGLIGRAIAIRGNRLGYEAAPTVFVIGAEEAAEAELTTLQVLRKLS